MKIAETTLIAAGIEVLVSEDGFVYANLNGDVLLVGAGGAGLDRDAIVDKLTRSHADGHYRSYGADPLFYVNEYLIK